MDQVLPKPMQIFGIYDLYILFISIGVSVLHYLQTVVPNVAVGAEVAYQYGPGIPGGGIAVISGVGRYTGIVSQNHDFE